jgi:site-specific recombinase XerD
MSQALVAALKAHRHLRGEFVFCDDGGERLSRGTLDWVLKKVCRRANLRWIGWHGLRHTFCSHLAMKGAPARAIQELAGHASLTTTQRYMHLTPGAGRAAIDLLGQPMGNARRVDPQER